MPSRGAPPERFESSRRIADLRRLAVPAGVALVVLLPFARGLLAGSSFFFRDLSRHFFPIRLFAVEGLRAGELRYWNPFIHEGEPLLPPPLGYPLDMLQALFDDEHGFTWLLVLHVVLGALAAFKLARSLGLPSLAAAGTAHVYALGGFFLSTLNLYVHLQAAAWAPLVILGLMRAAGGGRRQCAAAALITGVALTTAGIEIIAQAVVFGLVLSVRRDALARRLARIGLSLALGAALAAPVLLLWQQQLGAGARSGGFSTASSLAFSVHPWALLQIVVAGLFGDPPTSLKAFWGHRFFSGFPYFLSLYLGAAGLAMAFVGARRGEGPVGRIVILAVLGLLVCLGPFVRLDILLEALSPLRAFRFPSKAYFLVHLAASLLVGFGLRALVSDGARGTFRLVAKVAFGLALPLLLAPFALALLPGPTKALARDFFPEPYTEERRLDSVRQLTSDAAAGGSIALATGLIAALVATRRLRPQAGAVGVVALITADLVRAGVGVNPMVSPAFYEPSPESRELAARVAKAGGRIFTCDPASSFRLFQLLRFGGHDDDVRAVAALKETLSPSLNVTLRVPSAYSRDASGLVPENRALSPEDLRCADLAALAGRLRRASVSHVLTLDPVSAPGLALEATMHPEALAPLAVGLYRAQAPLPLRTVARQVLPAGSAREAAALASTPGFQDAGGTAVEGMGRGVEAAVGSVLAAQESSDQLRFQVEADRPTVLLVRDAWAPGWTATVDGRSVPVQRADGRHRAVPIPAGRSEVILSYQAPGLVLGCALASLSAVVIGLLACPVGRSNNRSTRPAALT